MQLTGFMMWIMSALSLTIRELDARKQTYKKQSTPVSLASAGLETDQAVAVFTRLYRILIGAAIIIVAFFVISSIAFSNRLDEDFAPDTWKTRWFLFDGWLGLLYLFCFAAIAYLWRPTGRNRYLMMSDEVAQDEGDAELYEAPGDEDDDEDGKGENGHDAIPLRGRGVGDDAVVVRVSPTHAGRASLTGSRSSTSERTMTMTRVGDGRRKKANTDLSAFQTRRTGLLPTDDLSTVLLH